MPPIDDAAAAAEIAAVSAAVAANDAAAAAVEAASEPQIDPNALLAADVEIARIEGETERARIEARAETRIAEIQQEEPAWLIDIKAFLARIEAMLVTLQSSIHPTTAATIVMEPPEAPVVVKNSGEAQDAPEVVETETVPAVEPSEQQAEAPAPAPRRPRWI